MMRNWRLVPTLIVSRTTIDTVTMAMMRCHRHLILIRMQTTSVEVDTTRACRSTLHMTVTKLVQDIPPHRPATGVGLSTRLLSQRRQRLMSRLSRSQRSHRRGLLRWRVSPMTVSLITCRVPLVRMKQTKNHHHHRLPLSGPHHPQKVKALLHPRNRRVRRKRNPDQGAPPRVLRRRLRRLHHRTRATLAVEVVTRSLRMMRKKEEVARGQSTPMLQPRQIRAPLTRSAAPLRASPSRSPNLHQAGHLEIRVIRTRTVISCRSHYQHLRESLPRRLDRRPIRQHDPCHHDRPA